MGETVAQCDVCDEYEVAHPETGRRTLSGAQVEALRKRMIIEAYEKMEAENPGLELDALARPAASFDEEPG